MNSYKEHYSVLNKEVIDFLTENAPDEAVYADMTFGAGGHCFAFKKAKPNSRVYAVDQDSEAFRNGLELINSQGYTDSIELFNINFQNFPQIAQEKDLLFDGIVMDLGVSSHHFDSFERGFSFRESAPLDMRMDISNNELTAKKIVNDYSSEELERIFFEYGEEKFSKTIVKNILESRERKEIETTKELEDIIFHSYPKKMRHGKTHPATKAFQALRIEVNKELEVLEKTLQKLFGLLKDGGRLAVISFHSLEDRIVKHEFKKIYQNNREFVKILTKRPLQPGDMEISENKRSRSAKLRVIEKNHGGFGDQKKYKKYKKET